MKMPSVPRSARLGLLGLVMATGSAGCDDFINGLSRGYVGPSPSRESITDEIATVAKGWEGYQGQIILILDRTRFVDAGDPHDVNRVIKAWTTSENQAQIAALQLMRGERVRISTEFSSIEEASGSMNVPNWPGHDAIEYPIGSHRITAISRVSP
jgi:hypothetical protein